MLPAIKKFVLSPFTRISVINEDSEEDSSDFEKETISSEDQSPHSYIKPRNRSPDFEMDCTTTDAAPHTKPTTKSISLTLNDVRLIEKDLEEYEKVSMAFLLHNNPWEALNQIIQLQQDPNYNVLTFWCDEENDNHHWREKFVEALANIQNYRVAKKFFGLNKNDLYERFLPNVPQTSVHLEKARKILYKICEGLSVKCTEDFLKVVQKDMRFKLFYFKSFDPRYLELYFLHWEHLGYLNMSDLGNIQKILKQLGHTNICDMLEPTRLETKLIKSNDIHKQVLDDDISLTDLTLSVGLRKDNGNSSQHTMQQDLGDNRYPIDVNNPGVCLIINQEHFYKEIDEKYRPFLTKKQLETRTGTKKDRNDLKQVFDNFGFKTIVKNNLTHVDMIDVIKGVAKKIDVDSSFFLCIMSHGDEGVIYGVNSCWVKVNQIQEILRKTKNLNGKPKILILQSCQGTRCQKINDEDDNLETDGDGRASVPGSLDMLTFWATVPGFGAIRHKVTGTWFIQSLCENIRNCGDTVHLLEICTRIICSVSEKKWNKDNEDVTMVPTIHSTLSKVFYFPHVKKYNKYL